MNRYLLAGCAAVALAMGSGAANAQAKFEVRIGGDAYFEAGYVDQDQDANERDTEFRSRFRLNIVPSAKADNGLEYGGRIRIRANNADGTMDADRALIFVAGSFGRVEMGVRNSYNDDSYVSRPIDFHFLGIVDSALTFAGAPSQGSLAELALTPNGNATKLVYLSPRFSGFQLGASYTPRNDGSDFGSSVDRAERTGELHDIWEIGFNYTGTFSGVSLAASGAYMGGEVQGTGLEDLTAWQLGAQVGYAGFILGGGYTNRGETGQASNALYNEDQEVWAVGIQYTTGPIVAGFGYTHGSDVGASAATLGDREQDYYTVGVSYTVAPGLSVGLEYSYIELENDEGGAANTANDDESSVIIARTVLRF